MSDLTAFMRSWRLLFVRYCHYCTWHADGYCRVTGAEVKPWTTCERWEDHAAV